MWPFSKLEKRLDQLQAEIAELRYRVKELEYLSYLHPKQEEKYPVNRDFVCYREDIDYSAAKGCGGVIQPDTHSNSIV